MTDNVIGIMQAKKDDPVREQMNEVVKELKR
jgi:hypothetical protein